MELIKEKVLLAVEIINEQGMKQGVLPRPMTVRSFLHGAGTKSPNHIFYRQFQELYGIYPKINKEEIISVLNQLIEEKKLKLNGKNYTIYTEQKNSDGISAYLMNSENARTVSDEEFYTLADWDNIPSKPDSITSIPIKMNDDYTYMADSKEEEAFVKRIKNKRYYKDLRGQSFFIEYKVKNRVKKYFPDIVLLTPDNKIAIIEIKQLEMMSNKKVICKYLALKEFAEANGYMYAMLDQKFKSFEYMKQYNFSKNIEKKMIELYRENKGFGAEQMNTLLKGKSVTQKKVYRRMFAAMIIQRRYTNSASVPYGFEIKKLKKLSCDYKY